MKGVKSALQMINEIIEELEMALICEDLKPDDIVESNVDKMKFMTTDKTILIPNERKGLIESSTNKSKNSDLTVNCLDLRVGIISKIWRHETAEKLYCEEIDVGEASFRSIASGMRIVCSTFQ
jgi:tRNA-binding EMAP/Myf-like protein